MLNADHMKFLGEIRTGKVVPRNFGSIKHFTGSKMIDDEDKLYDLEGQKKFTEKLRKPRDRVIVTEKLDGMNAGIIKIDGKLIPINKKGYDVRTMLTCQDGTPNWLFYFWARWVNVQSSKLGFAGEIAEGSRLVFENCMFKHTLDYNFETEPVFLLAAYNADGSRKEYSEMKHMASQVLHVPTAPVLNIGAAVNPQHIVNQYPKGLSGVKGEMEGVVYTYETQDRFESSGKFVSNKKMGMEVPFPNKFNKFPRVEQYELVRYQACEMFGIDYDKHAYSELLDYSKNGYGVK